MSSCWLPLNCTLTYYILRIDEKYGKVVRMAPNELAFAHSDAWKDIHRHSASSQPTLEKWGPFYSPLFRMTANFVGIWDWNEPDVLRHQISRDFSEIILHE
jgi:hypothetical protein